MGRRWRLIETPAPRNLTNCCVLGPTRILKILIGPRTQQGPYVKHTIDHALRVKLTFFQGSFQGEDHDRIFFE